MTSGFVEFEFDLPDALLTSLVGIFDKMKAAPLTPEAVATLPDEQGVYQLLLNDEIVYIGKTDGDAGLRKRLSRHSFTIQHRQNLDTATVVFKAVRVFVFTAIDLETQLIRHYGATKPVAWNNSGFGSNDPGRNRDDTDLKPKGFDANYPIDLDQPIDIELVPGASLAAIISAIRQALPYYFRAEAAAPRSRVSHPDLQAATFVGPALFKPTMRTAVLSILASLPAGWQATLLAGRVILYKEAKDYRWGVTIGRS
ncbi:GIY-YIG nuclease family protein [Phreatobacter sp. AB_2022a]|uniref:GIY-YIG nuclease family protein n=1 Tax=Phreatobacter sp. AB_2022a TaxID=3003134 RepID=UPI0022876EAB|nr:GIY-YIG nuclease family protein [Phreatobacter sp. AB_2022a]MCZ0735677.1 GIY-YIG nuclease family protein [Phreatobacter sp. AB_2022a]